MPGDFAADAMLSAVLRHIGRSRGTSRSVERVLREAAAERARGTCPVAVDGMLHQLFAGMPERLLRETAQEWYAQYRQEHDPIPPGFWHLPRHLPVVIVSDAPATSLLAVAAQFHAAQFRDVHVLGGTPAVDGCGLLTGANDGPMVGPARVARVRRLLANLDVEASRCVAVGRGSADTALLELVGTPIVIGDNDHLHAVAARSNWTVLAATPDQYHADVA